MRAYRVERDTLGEVQVPAEALYGPQTQRAVDNFLLSGMHLPAPFIHALGLIKLTAARVNAELGLLLEARAQAIGYDRAAQLERLLDPCRMLTGGLAGGEG